MALTATATRSTQSLIIDSLNLTDVVKIEVNPDRDNIFYESKKRPSYGDDKLNPILEPLADKLKEMKDAMPLTIIYGTLQTCASCFMYFSSVLGKNQYFPSNSKPISKNRLFAQFHAECPQHEKERIIEEMVQGVCTARVLFATVAFGMGIDIPNIRHVIHIGVPKTMEEYFQETGRSGRDGDPSIATLYYNSHDIRQGKNEVDAVMRELATSDSCKREIILKYFGHDVKHKPDYHNCCDYHRSVCDCLLCLDKDENSELKEQDIQPTVPVETDEACVSISVFQKKSIREDLERYRASLQFGRSCVGSITLATGFSIELIDMTIEHCGKFKSVNDIHDLLPVYSKEHAKVIFDIVSQYTKL